MRNARFQDVKWADADTRGWCVRTSRRGPSLNTFYLYLVGKENKQGKKNRNLPLPFFTKMNLITVKNRIPILKCGHYTREPVNRSLVFLSRLTSPIRTPHNQIPHIRTPHLLHLRPGPPSHRRSLIVFPAGMLDKPVAHSQVCLAHPWRAEELEGEGAVCPGVGP